MTPQAAWARCLVTGLIVFLCLSGCASRPENVFLPAGNVVVPGASRVDMLVATTRRPAVVPGEMFGGDRGEPSFANIQISIPPDAVRKIGDVQWPRKMPADPATEFATLQATVLSKDQVTSAFHARVLKAPGRSVLVFVHGYNNRFDDAVFRFAQIAHDSGTQAVPVLFAWPSRGATFAYAYDRESANYSRDALEALLNYFVRDPSVGEISILAHSMGNWVTIEALRQMSIRNHGFSAKIKNIMLASPDVDVDVFRMQMTAMGENHPRITLFVSSDDKALAGSRWLWGSTARLGQIDPQAEPYNSFLQKNKIDVVDLSKVKSDDRFNHGKFAESPQVVKLIGRQLSGGQPITDQAISLADRLVAIPIDVVTPAP